MWPLEQQQLLVDRLLVIAESLERHESQNGGLENVKFAGQNLICDAKAVESFFSEIPSLYAILYQWHGFQESNRDRWAVDRHRVLVVDYESGANGDAGFGDQAGAITIVDLVQAFVAWADNDFLLHWEVDFSSLDAKVSTIRHAADEGAGQTVRGFQMHLSLECQRWTQLGRFEFCDESYLLANREHKSASSETIQATVYCLGGSVPEAIRLVRLVRQLINVLKLKLEFFQRLSTEKLNSMKRLAYGASHEINNPLANIATRAQTLILKEADPHRRQTLQVINAQAFRGFDMLANLMHFAAPPKAEIKCVDLLPLVQQSLNQTKAFFPDVQLEVDCADLQSQQTRLANVDSQQMVLMIIALLRNAIEASGVQIGETNSGQFSQANCETPKTVVRLGIVLCSTSFPGSKLPAAQLCVWDEASVVDPNLLPFVCDPFHSGREAGRGLGFGLSKVYRIVEMNGGQMRLQSLQPKGLKVSIYLPA